MRTTCVCARAIDGALSDATPAAPSASTRLREWTDETMDAPSRTVLPRGIRSATVDTVSEHIAPCPQYAFRREWRARSAHFRVDVESHDPPLQAGFRRRVIFEHQRIMPGHDVVYR